MTGKDASTLLPMRTVSARRLSHRLTGPGNRSPFAFFVLVFVLLVPFWAVGAATGLQLPLDLPVSSFIWVCPVIAASLLVYRENGTAGVAALLRRGCDFAPPLGVEVS